jgi:hypothetical protein
VTPALRVLTYAVATLFVSVTVLPIRPGWIESMPDGDAAAWIIWMIMSALIFVALSPVTFSIGAAA